ncbi:MAG TPA: DUF3105 domain-containing protein [Solirubrobacteraceae bacterium]|nr:DUF3105 domain-containing protein [Solirubrobacteraceae bacterium]
MPGRDEEKEQRKRERRERERADAAAAKRRRRLQIGMAVAIVLVVGVGGGVALTGGDAGNDRPGEGELKRAASSARCTYRAFPNEGQEHADRTFTADDYKTNPPTSGPHAPPGQQAADGLYGAGNEPGVGRWVHTLEHGRVILMYNPAAPAATVGALQRLFEEPVLGSGKSYHMLLMRNNTQMPFEAAAVAWRHYIGCRDTAPAAIAAMRAFRDRWIDRAPEFVP